MARFKEWINRPSSSLIISCFFGALTFLLRLPLLFRYDVFFGADPGITYLMPIRILQGERPFYFLGQNYHAAVESYLIAGLFKLFGPSIPLASSVALFEWSLGVGIGVYLFIRATSPLYGVIGGIFAAISVPYTLIYITVPFIGYPPSFFITLLLLLEALFLVQKGPSVSGLFWFGFTIGASLYIAKQCIPGIGAAFLALLFFETPKWSIRRSISLFQLGSGGIGFLTGYLPEIWYRFHNPYRSFSGVATPLRMAHNFWESMKSFMAYFDSHPFSRIPEDIYFYHDIPYKLIHPATPLDMIFTLLMIAVLIFSINRFWVSGKERNPALFLLTALLFVNLTAVILSKESGGDLLNTRRYLMISAIPISLLTSLFFLYVWKQSSLWFQWFWIAVGVLFLGHTAFDQYALLERPDSLREIRWIIQDMNQQGLNRGLSYFGPNYTIDALSNQQIIIADREGDGDIAEYRKVVSQAERIAVIGYKNDPIEKEITFEGYVYHPDGEIRQDELMRWIPYQKVLQ